MGVGRVTGTAPRSSPTGTAVVAAAAQRGSNPQRCADREEVNLDDIEKVIERNLVGVSSAPMEDGRGKDHRAMVEAPPCCGRRSARRITVRTFCG